MIEALGFILLFLAVLMIEHRISKIAKDIKFIKEYYANLTNKDKNV